jgi:hypothetical protein
VILKSVLAIAASLMMLSGLGGTSPIQHGAPAAGGQIA